MSFEKLGLRAELVRAVADKGYETPSPIQARAIPAILAGRDVQGGAQTGTGKTAAFVLPMLQLLDGRPSAPRCPRALVLTPTRELAAQVGASAVAYGRGLKLRSATVFGGVGINPQISALRQGVDILVATPGRLLDLAGQRAVDLRSVEILVLDEADRMLDMGFIHDIRRILKLLPDKRQNLLFSATYSDDVKKLVDGLLRNPEVIEVARRNTAAEKVDQVAYSVAKGDKRQALSQLIIGGKWEQVLVFARTKHGANRLATQLGKDGIHAAAIHGNKSQSARTRALADFKARKVQVLVATDIAARGLDIVDLPHVVNYELPNVPEDYVHRIGRTGRAGAEGSAVSLVGDDETKLLKAIERVLKRSIPLAPLPPFKGTMPMPRPASPARSQISARPEGSPGRRREDSSGGGRRGPGRRSRGGSSGGRTETRASHPEASASKAEGPGFGGRLKSLFGRRGRAPSGRP